MNREFFFQELRLKSILKTDNNNLAHFGQALWATSPTWYQAVSKEESEVSPRPKPEKEQKVSLTESKSKAKSLSVLFLEIDRGESELGRMDSPARQLLDNMMKAMKLAPHETAFVAIQENEKSKLWEQRIIDYNPRVVVALGGISANIILNLDERLQNIHGKFFNREFGPDQQKIVIMPVFHPEYLLVNGKMKRPAWEDLQKVMEFLQNSEQQKLTN